MILGIRKVIIQNIKEFLEIFKKKIKFRDVDWRGCGLLRRVMQYWGEQKSIKLFIMLYKNICQIRVYVR